MRDHYHHLHRWRWHLPILRTCQHYSLSKAKADLKAGLNVALLDFPQGMAYALIAGLPYTMGIIASITASILGPIFASSRHIMLGPTNAIAVLSLSLFLSMDMTPEQTLAAAPILLLMVAGFLIIGSVLKLASIINFVSGTVVTGYITAAAFLIIIKQSASIFGLNLAATNTFVSTLLEVVRNLPASQWQTLELSLLTVAVYWFFKLRFSKLPTVAVTLILIYLVTDFLRKYGIEYATLGVHSLILEKQEATSSITLEWITSLVPGALAISFLSLLESASISKTLAAQSGETVDINQQMFSMGIANLGCAVTGGMPISGSLTRSALNFRSGASTSLSSVFSGFFLLIGFILLAPYISNIPKAALSSLIVLVGISLINRPNIRIAISTTRSDSIVFWMTFVCGLFFSLNFAIFAGVITSFLLFIKRASKPDLLEYTLQAEPQNVDSQQDRHAPEIVLLHVEGDLFFASSDLFLSQARNITRNPDIKAVVIRLRNAHNLDATCAMALKQFVLHAQQKSCYVLISGAHEEVQKVLNNSKLTELIQPEHIFAEDPINPTLSTSLALKKAKELVGQDAELKLFLGKTQCEE